MIILLILTGLLLVIAIIKVIETQVYFILKKNKTVKLKN